jgi:nitrate/nitrite-specific signal transduction histidine kinase
MKGRYLPAVVELAENAAGQSDQLGFTAMRSNLVDGTNAVALSQPLYGRDGDVRGAAVGLFRIERQATRTSAFYRNIWELYIGRRVTLDPDVGSQISGQEAACLVDGEGHILFHSDTFLIGEDASQYESVQRALQGESGARRTRPIRTPNGPEVITGYAPVPQTSWALITEVPWSQVVRTTRPTTRVLLILLGLGIVIPALVVALAARQITRPLEGLTEAAKALAGGQFEQRLNVHTGDELETLAEQFNTMAQALQASYANLERRVADRTKELATVNAVAAVVNRSLQLEKILATALRETMDAMDIERGAALRLEGDVLHLMAHQGFSDRFIDQVRTVPLSASLASEAQQAGQPATRRTADYPPGSLKDALQREGVASVIAIPLIAKEAVLGVINLVTPAPRALNPDELSMLASIGRQTGLAVENARLYEQAEEAAAAAERNRLARDLHDAVSQTLFTASLIADVLPTLWERNPEEARRQLVTLRRLTRGAQAEMRTLLMELRPTALLEADLQTLLGHLSQAAAARADLEVTLDLEDVPALPSDAKVAYYRIAQEALNNVVKHARAGRIVVSLHRTGGPDGALEMSIQDNGQGFRAEAVSGDHFGLHTMRERADAIGAAMTLESEPGAGTTLTVRWTPDGNVKPVRG